MWGDTVALPVRVRPPFWMTTWFRLASLLALVAAIAGGHRWRTLLLRRRNRALALPVAARTAALQSANLQLDHQANHDALTGLLNRRAIVARFEQELGGGRTRHFGCILIDLNRFKQVNDTLGHALGDGVLQQMAASIRGCLRDGDALGRLGGDEFLVLMAGAGDEALESACRRISALAVEAADDRHRVTVTAACGGVAVPSGGAPELAAILARADELLYRVKNAGRLGYAVDTLAAPASVAD